MPRHHWAHPTRQTCRFADATAMAEMQGGMLAVMLVILVLMDTLRDQLLVFRLVTASLSAMAHAVRLHGRPV
jgi:hypothetical protein